MKPSAVGQGPLSATIVLLAPFVAMILAGLLPGALVLASQIGFVVMVAAFLLALTLRDLLTGRR